MTFVSPFPPLNSTYSNRVWSTSVLIWPFRLLRSVQTCNEAKLVVFCKPVSTAAPAPAPTCFSLGSFTPNTCLGIPMLILPIKISLNYILQYTRKEKPHTLFKETYHCTSLDSTKQADLMIILIHTAKLLNRNQSNRRSAVLPRAK